MAILEIVSRKARGYEEALAPTQTCIGSPVHSFFWASGSLCLRLLLVMGKSDCLTLPLPTHLW